MSWHKWKFLKVSFVILHRWGLNKLLYTLGHIQRICTVTATAHRPYTLESHGLWKVNTITQSPEHIGSMQWLCRIVLALWKLRLLGYLWPWLMNLVEAVVIPFKSLLSRAEPSEKQWVVSFFKRHVSMSGKFVSPSCSPPGLSWSICL